MKIYDIKTEKQAKYSIFVNTCDKFEDCWDPFFKLFTIYWPNYKGKIYLNTEYKDYSYPGLDIIPIKGCVGKKITRKYATWSQCLKWAMDFIPDDIVLYMQEDYFLKDFVKNNMIDNAVELMQNNKIIKCIHLTDQGYYSTGPSDFDGYDLNAIGRRYRVSCQAALWDKRELISLIREHESAWQFEEYGSKRSNIMKHQYLGVSKNIIKKDKFEILPYVFTGIIKGRWFEETIPLFEKHNIKIEWQKRGFVSDIPKESFSNKVIRKINRIPYEIRSEIDLIRLKWTK